MGFDGAATSSGDKAGVQRRLKELSPHALFVAVMSFNWLLCKLLMLHQVSGMSTLSLKEIQKVLDLQDLKIVKRSDTLACT